VRRSAFTLIEVVISAGLMSLILVSAYLCLNAGLKGKKVVEPRADVIQTARVAMNIMAADLRAACPIAKDYQFLGMRRTLGEMDADNIDFGTHNYTPRRALEGDFCQASFFVDIDPETGRYALWRRRNPVIAIYALEGGSREEIAKSIVGLRFEYSDGLDWYDNWGDVKPPKSDDPPANMVGMPEAVRITLKLAANPDAKKSADAPETAEPPMVFQTIVKLELSGSSLRSTSSVGPGFDLPSGSATSTPPPTGGSF
ncbi:MAG: putative ral secretion pathway protein, partial [Verrucomicrobiota bacterium]